MKKILLLSVAFILLLTGCKDAKVNVTNEKTAIAKVGNVEISKQTIANALESYKYAATLEEVKEILYNQYVPMSDEVNKLVEEKINVVKERSKKANISWEESLKNAQTTEADYRKDVILPSVKAELLTKKYIVENFNQYIEKFGLVKFEILEATNEENGKKALEEIKKGKSFADAAKEFGNVTHYPGNKPVVAYLNSTAVVGDVYTLISQAKEKEVRLVKSSTGTNYVFRLVSKDPNAFKNEAIEELIKSPIAVCPINFRW